MAGKGEAGQGRIGWGLMREWSAAAVIAVVTVLTLGTSSALAAPPTITAKRIVTVSAATAVLEAEATTGAKASSYHFEYDTSKYGEGEGEHGTATPTGTLRKEESPATVSATIEGLVPNTVYHFRAVIKNADGTVVSADRSFSTYAPPLSGLPDGRVYEQASPVDKDGGDLTGTPSFVKAALSGGGISFGSNSGIPGGEGAQNLPYYLSTRAGEGWGASWSSRGLLPPASSGQNASILGWTPDFSHVYQRVVHFGAKQSAAIFERPGEGGTSTQVTPFVEGPFYAFAGANADDSEAVFESRSAKLGTNPAGTEGRSNVYAWDAGAKALSLASRLNTQAETEAALPSGAFAGPYDWATGTGNTSEGGAARLYYTHDSGAVGKDGSVFFTAAGSAHLYERINPTQPQSTMSGKECTEPAKACTIDISASRRTTPDAGGHQPATFQFATADSDTAIFSSSEKLTDDATTGPEVPAPAIGRLTLNGEVAEEELDEYFPGVHGVGVAVDGSHIYWVDPSKGTISRATLNGSEPPIKVNASFIEPGETCFETHPVTKPGAIECAPSTPRYVAVRGEYVYWTNTGPLGNDANFQPQEEPVKGGGTIGRAKINPTTEEAEEVEPEFIKGASDPQGIAVNETHIYWANALDTENQTATSIGRAKIGGEEAEQQFFNTGPLTMPFGVALSATRVYWASESYRTGFNLIESIPLEGGSKEVVLLGQSLGARGVALAGAHLYWTDQATGAIGRIGLPLEEPSDPSSRACSDIARCEGEFAKPGGALLGLGADAFGSHLYWSANGEVPPHLGHDLYRYRAAGTGGCEEAEGCLDDLTVDSDDTNGAQVLGLLGASADASRLYFVANGVLSGAPNEAGETATAGTCHGQFGPGPDSISGHCSIYLWEGGSISFIARLDPGGVFGGDSTDWLPTIASDVLNTQKTAFASADGKTLLFKSQEQLTAYDNEGISELYLYRLGEGITCVSCDPSGAGPSGKATLGTISYPLLEAEDTTAVASRNLATDGKRAFFETPDPLVPEDTNGSKGCPLVGSDPGQRFPACRDVYEWEAAGTGSCKAGGEAFSAPNGGCLYLISTGKSDWASIFADASADGNDVFFFTRQGLVGQDGDELLDVYDAKVGGGILSQSPPAKVLCESPEACHGPGQVAPAEEPAASATFTGPQDPKPKRGKPKKQKHHKHAHHKKRHGAKHSKNRSNAKRGADR